jgi:hypothetical protein
LISLDFIAPSGVQLTLADGTSCQMDEIRHQVLRPKQGYATLITSVLLRRPAAPTQP